MAMSFTELSLNTPDISRHVLKEPGRPRIMPASFYRLKTQDERSFFCLKNGIYCLPTEELIRWLGDFIQERKAIEIGAGNGAISAALQIRATDNHMQSAPGIAAYYTAHGQPPVQYGRHVERLDAAEAVRKYKPDVVIAAWVTHKYDPARHDAGGNAYGVDEEDIIANCDAYVFIGNRNTHKHKSIWKLPHTVIEPDWLFSRASSGLPDFIAVWERAKL